MSSNQQVKVYCRYSLKMVPLSYNSKLRSKIHNDFTHTVIPGNLLPVIKKYDSNVLSERDMDHIRTVINTRGNITGAEELLDYMSRYANWFPCLLRALSDNQVKQEPFARYLQQLKAELDAAEQPCAERHVFQERPTPRNEFVLDDGSAAAGNVNHSEVEGDGPMDEEPRYETIDIDGSQPSSQELYQIPVTLTETGDGAAASSLTPEATHTFGQGGRGGAQEARLHQTRHGREYDFTKEETESEFSAFQGWNRTISESSIKEKLEPYLDQDGRYVLWYWTEMKRPAISVIYGGVMKNFIIHKKPRKSIPGVVKYYFINKEQHCDPSLTRLVQFHLNRGIKNTEPGCHRQIIPLQQHFDF
ncbi:hypothetical protein RRG08_010080 [Elysia crispata]|uniref:Caspase recruitment domain-containing protein n=1 Tax=Elysia crispata TaxID=231223 RepID=A0AAE1A4F9_9GAST|nr:hypothetical protein RRG08_010080 [Elysia crispata]